MAGTESGTMWEVTPDISLSLKLQGELGAPALRDPTCHLRSPTQVKLSVLPSPCPVTSPEKLVFLLHPVQYPNLE
jgi:hypothetical protein